MAIGEQGRDELTVSFILREGMQGPRTVLAYERMSDSFECKHYWYKGVSDKEMMTTAVVKEDINTIAGYR